MFLVLTNTSFQPSHLVVFGQVAPAATDKFGFVFQWICLTMVTIYGIVQAIRVRIRLKNKSCMTVLMVLISPEYDHEQITIDYKKAKRYDWHHFLFFRYEDEHIERQMKLWFEKQVTRVKKLFSICKKEPVPSEPVPVASEAVVTKKKKKKKSIVFEDENSAWNLWDKAKKGKEEEEQEKQAKAKQAVAGNKKKRIGKSPGVTPSSSAQTNKSMKTGTATNSPSKSIKGAVRGGGSKVKPEGKGVNK